MRNLATNRKKNPAREPATFQPFPCKQAVPEWGFFNEMRVEWTTTFGAAQFRQAGKQVVALRTTSDFVKGIHRGYPCSKVITSPRVRASLLQVPRTAEVIMTLPAFLMPRQVMHVCVA